MRAPTAVLGCGLVGRGRAIVFVRAGRDALLFDAASGAAAPHPAVAGAAPYPAAPASGPVTGTCLRADGGSTAR